jgi:hypothetical protein
MVICSPTGLANSQAIVSLIGHNEYLATTTQRQLLALAVIASTIPQYMPSDSTAELLA